MSELDDYLEKRIFEDYKQSIADEENLTRSLPFFATSLAVLGALGVAGRDAIPMFSYSPYPAVVWGLICIAASQILWCLWCLYRAAVKKDFTYPMYPSTLLAWANKLQDYYQEEPGGSEGPGESSDAEETGDGEKPGGDAGRCALTEIKTELLSQAAKAATNNRNINDRRIGLRASALTALFRALLFAFLLIAVIITENKVFADGQINGAENEDGRGGERKLQGAASSENGDQTGKESETAGPTNGEKEVTSRPTAPTPKPQTSSSAVPPTAAPKPPPPPMQTLKKSTDPKQ